MQAIVSRYSDGRMMVSGCFTARLIDVSNSDEVSNSQRLRYGYFCLSRGWAQGDSTTEGHDIDRYDEACHHLGVFQGGELLAYLRALPWHESLGFMLEDDFRCLVPDAQIKGMHRQTGLEISRLVLAPGLSTDTNLQVTELLFKLLYQFCLEHRFEHLYAVLEAGWIRRFSRCFNLSFSALGKPHRFPDGTRTVAAHASLRELEASLNLIAPEKLRWYQAR